MAGLNNFQGIGYLGRDPELRHTQQGTAVATINVAMTRKYRNAKDELVEETEWARVVAWDKMGETAAEFLRKGSLVYVQGRLRTSSYEDGDGVKRWATEIVAEQLQFLDRKPGGDSRPHPAERGDDEAASARTAKGADPGRAPRGGGGGPPDLGPPDHGYLPSSGDNDDIPF